MMQRELKFPIPVSFNNCLVKRGAALLPQMNQPHQPLVSSKARFVKTEEPIEIPQSPFVILQSLLVGFWRPFFSSFLVLCESWSFMPSPSLFIWWFSFIFYCSVYSYLLVWLPRKSSSKKASVLTECFVSWSILVLLLILVVISESFRKDNCIPHYSVLVLGFIEATAFLSKFMVRLFLFCISKGFIQFCTHCCLDWVRESWFLNRMQFHYGFRTLWNLSISSMIKGLYHLDSVLFRLRISSISDF